MPPAAALPRRAPTARLIIDSTERSADLRWLTRMYLPGPAVWARCGGVSVMILSELELDRAREAGAADRVLPIGGYHARARKRHGRTSPAHAAAILLEELGARRVEVPATFPALLDRTLARLGFDVVPVEGDFVPARRRKTAREARAIAAASAAAGEAIALAADMLRRGRAAGGAVVLDGAPLTSERIRDAVRAHLAARGYDARELIAAGRNGQSSLPHCEGSGPLCAGEPLILDFFPRDVESGYHGDVTRTVVKGRAGRRLRAMHAAVRAAEREVAAMLRPGVETRALHERALSLLRGAGFPTGRRGGRARGFFHGIGHGLGLEIHERPSFASQGERLREGDVVTVEPGLYYPETGGVRHENVYRVTRAGAVCLSPLEIPFEIE